MADTATATDEAGGSSVPDAAVVSLVDAVSHALDTGGSSGNLLGPPPPPLPQGWIMKESRSQPNYFYYYHMDTGTSQWENPAMPQQEHQLDQPLDNAQETEEPSDHHQQHQQQPQDSTPKAVESMTGSDSSWDDRKRSLESKGDNETASKRAKTTSQQSGKPSKVRIFHILKKHKDSRRPSSWRQPKIISTKEEATEELQGLIDILQEESGEDQRATFEELARTESDCSSAKRGGDLGFFGPKKMQPAFEEASFALNIGELSGIVETSSGVHVLLRIG